MPVGYILHKALKGQRCTACGAPLRSTTLAEPAPGDFVMCMECGEIMLFTLRKAEEAEIQAADEKTRELILGARANFKPPKKKGRKKK